MATLSAGGRVTGSDVDEEIARLRERFEAAPPIGEAERADPSLEARIPKGLDRFDRVQLADVLAVCAESRSLSEAGRVLFAESRKTRATTNDADRLRKYLARFGLSFPAS